MFNGSSVLKKSDYSLECDIDILRTCVLECSQFGPTIDCIFRISSKLSGVMLHIVICITVFLYSKIELSYSTIHFRK